ncbi:hypothetical protein [Streptomyces sp. NBC_00829]|nr:hypothetical protein OG293_06445 [Streptomyces sp. NBC_00829]
MGDRRDHRDSATDIGGEENLTAADGTSVTPWRSRESPADR